MNDNWGVELPPTYSLYGPKHNGFHKLNLTSAAVNWPAMLDELAKKELPSGQYVLVNNKTREARVLTITSTTLNEVKVVF